MTGVAGPRPTALVIGYGLSGRAAASWLADGGYEVVVIEDKPRPGAEGLPADLRAEVSPSPERSAELARSADLVVPSPGVPVGHVALVAAAQSGRRVVSEIELGWEALQRLRQGEVAGARAGEGPGRAGEDAGADGPVGAGARGHWPRLVAITGTNGKTTVTKLVTAMLCASGCRAVAAGNVGLPLLEAVRALGPGEEVTVVAEVSSFQLEYVRTFRPDVSCWLNFAPDHLDWHSSLGHYARAKAKIWANQGTGDVAVFNADDTEIIREVEAIARQVRRVGFGREVGPTVAWRVGPASIEGPRGLVLKASELPRALPHDLANTAASMAIAFAAGASEQGCREAARLTFPPPHRVQFVGEADGVAWYDDSKATTPAAVLAGISGFGSVVLIAGGRNKGLDLSALAGTTPPVRAVVAIGEAAREVRRAFAGRAEVVEAASMPAAVDAAGDLARPGDAVVLSPGCASFDWYSSYEERGDQFAALVRAKLGGAGAAAGAQAPREPGGREAQARQPGEERWK
jgi:UDP-N-acetylmuramoylalanine--D-glutamate ligase